MQAHTHIGALAGPCLSLTHPVSQTVGIDFMMPPAFGTPVSAPFEETRDSPAKGAISRVKFVSAERL